MAMTSTAVFSAASFSPSCYCIAVKRSGEDSVAAVSAGTFGECGGYVQH
jgi:hypothetical protein